MRCGAQRSKARPVCEQRHDGVTEKPKSVIDHEHDAPEMRADGGVQSPRSRKALAPEFVPRNMRDLLYSVMREVKTGQTRLAVYLRGWCTLRPHYEGNAPPSIKPCISTAKNRGTKEFPPRIGLFPCLPVAELGNSLEDRYVNFILGVSSYVAVGGKHVPLASFRRSTSKEHVALIKHIRKQLWAFFEACADLDPYEVLGSGRSGRLLSDALERAGATGPISGLHGSKGFTTGVRVQDLQPCAIMPLVAARLAFPALAADWDLADYLHGELKDAYEDPTTLRVADWPK